MHQVQPQFIPILSTHSGMSMSADNWQEADCNMAAFYLDSLLLKPGYSLLSSLCDWRAYFVWLKPLVLNLSHIQPDKDGIYTLTSPYDGQRIQLEYAQLIELIMHAKPDKVILPAHILRDMPFVLDNWDKAVMPYFSVHDLKAANPALLHGVYFNLNHPHADLIQELKAWQHLSRYACGSIDLNLIAMLKNLRVDFIESDAPAHAGVHGVIYTSEGVLNLKERALESMPFKPIESACSCPTCASGLTQAYVHHLYHNTPLLCQRFLVQHNAHYVQALLK